METISLRQFAERVGVSLTAVQKGEKNGRIEVIRNPDSGRITGIDWDTQSAAWEDNCKAPQRRAHNQAGGRPRKDGQPVAAPKTAPTPPADAPRRGPGRPTAPPPPDGQITMAEAQRNRELIKLQLDVLKLKEAEGELVRADDVKRDMGKLAAMVKSGLMNIPDRIAAELAGMNDPHEIHTLITSEIISTMGELLTAAEQ